MRTPTSTWPSNRMRSPVSDAGRNVGGLPTSWSSTPQASVGEAPAGKPIEHHAGVHPDVAFWMILRWLPDAFHGCDFRQQFAKKSGVVEKLKTVSRGAFGQQLGQFIANALWRHEMDFRGVFANGRQGVRFDLVSEARRKSHRAQHSQLVFGEPSLGFADSANDARREICTPAYKVQHFTGVMLHQQAVDGEVAALNIFLRRARVDDLVRMAAVGVADVAAERRDLNLVAVPWNQHHSELRADPERIRKQLLTSVGVALVVTS